MGTSTLKALWEKHWDYFSLFLTPFTSSHFRDYNNWLWLKSFQATCTITKYNDNIHHGNKRMSLLNLHVIWIEMLILIICLYNEFVWVFFFVSISFPPSECCFVFITVHVVWIGIYLCVEHDLFLWHFIVLKNMIKNEVLDITFVFCIVNSLTNH